MDCEILFIYKLVIRGMDSVNLECVRRLVIKEIIIVLEDVNDNKFRFLILLVVVVLSDVDVNSFVVIILVKDIDEGINL